MTYGAFYFCRNNLGVALPGIQESLGFTKTDMGVALMALKIAYGSGQFLNGQLAEKFSPRWMLAIGMFASAALNVAFGFGTGLYFFIFVWACNGYFQSLGWTPCVRVVGNWIPVQRRGKAIGIIGTGYQLTAGLTYLVAGFSIWAFGWQGALWIPPVILSTAALLMLLLLRESPNHHQTDKTQQKDQSRPPTNFLTNLRLTLTNPALWLLALSLGMLNASRYGFVDWGVSHLVAVENAKVQSDDLKRAIASPELSPEQKKRLENILASDLLVEETQKKIKIATDEGLLTKLKKVNVRSSTLKAAIKYAILPLGAIFGAFLSGWATDRFFGSRRAPVICGLLVMLGCLTIIYGQVAQAALTNEQIWNAFFPISTVLLFLVGFTIYGPQVLLVGTAPADLARQGTSAAAAGFVNCVGYIGAASGDYVTAKLADTHGWQTAIYAWAGWAFCAAILAALLWNATAKSGDNEPDEEMSSKKN